jgi:Leucine Rich repeats (2 copies)
VAGDGERDSQDTGERLNLFKQKKPDPFDSAEKAYAEAERRITEAHHGGLTKLELDLPHLQLIPPSVAGLSSLRFLSLYRTRVTDLRPLAGLTELQSLNLIHSLVTDLTPLARFTKLLVLGLSGTPVRNIGPLSDLRRLQTLLLSNTQVVDILPLAGLKTLVAITLDDTGITDLTPLATNTVLIDGAIWANATEDSSFHGLTATGTAIARTAPFDRLLVLEQPAATVETINYLRRQQGLPEYRGAQWSDAEPPLPDPASIPEQVRAAIVWGGGEGEPIRAIIRPGEGPTDTPDQRDFHAEIRDKARRLGDRCSGTGNNQLGGMRTASERLIDAMGATLPDLRPALFWSRMNALRRQLEIDARARSSRDPDVAPLPEDVAGELADLVDTLNVFAAGDDMLVERDRLSIDPATRIATETLLEAAREMARAAQDSPAVVEVRQLTNLPTWQGRRSGCRRQLTATRKLPPALPRTSFWNCCAGVTFPCENQASLLVESSLLRRSELQARHSQYQSWISSSVNSACSMTS